MTENSKRNITGMMVVALALATGSAAWAQGASTPASTGWSADAAIGWDNSISGNINSSGIGAINGQTVVITRNKYEDVYGTGLHFRFGGGYMLNDALELRGTFTFQSLDAELVPMGDIGVSNLYGQYDDYQSLGLDLGVRTYQELSPRVRGYAEGTIGIAFVDETDVNLVAPQANLSGNATDFYDRTAAMTFGAAVGLVLQTGSRVEPYGQIGIRWVSGMAEVDGLVGTGLETINDRSGRWTLPFIGGIRIRF